MINVGNDGHITYIGLLRHDFSDLFNCEFHHCGIIIKAKFNSLINSSESTLSWGNSDQTED